MSFEISNADLRAAEATAIAGKLLIALELVRVDALIVSQMAVARAEATPLETGFSDAFALAAAARRLLTGVDIRLAELRPLVQQQTAACELVSREAFGVVAH